MDISEEKPSCLESDIISSSAYDELTMEIPEKSNTIDSAILGAFEIMLANLLASIRLPNPGESSFTLNRRMLPSSFSSCASAPKINVLVSGYRPGDARWIGGIQLKIDQCSSRDARGDFRLSKFGFAFLFQMTQGVP